MNAVNDGLRRAVQIAARNQQPIAAINEESGFLYRCGGSSNGLRIFSLADPANPEFVGMWPDRYVHDAQIVTMQTGPFAGREIAFCCSGFNGGQTETGLDIVDVTDKSNLVNLGRIVYPQGEYSHQCWLSADEQFIYLNDELEEQRRGGFSRTVVLDVSDLTSPQYVGRFENGSRAITHNNYIRDGFMFAANYQSGLRIFELSDPSEGTEVAFFDTFPKATPRTSTASGASSRTSPRAPSSGATSSGDSLSGASISRP